MKSISLIRFFSGLLLSTSSLLCSANTLNEVYQQALQNNARYQVAQAAHLAGQEQQRINRASLLPQLSIQGQYSDSSIDSEGSTLNGIVSTDTEQLSYSASLRQTLFDLTAWNNWQQGKALSQASQARFNQAQQDLIFRCAETYFSILRAIDNLKSSEAEEAAISQQLEQTRQRFEVGLTSVTDVLETQATYDAIVAERLSFSGDVGIRFEALTNLTGQTWKAIAPLKESFRAQNPEPQNPQAWVQQTIENSPLLKAAQQQQRAAEYNAKAQRSVHLPTLSGSIVYNDSDSDGAQQSAGIDTPFDSTSNGTTFLLSLDMPLYLGGRVHAQRRQAHYLAEQARAETSFTQRDLEQSSRSLYLRVKTDVARVKARQQGLRSSQSALEATQAGYEVGTRNTVDLLVAQQNLYRSRRDYANVRYDYILNLLRLKQAAGALQASDLLALDETLESKTIEMK